MEIIRTAIIASSIATPNVVNNPKGLPSIMVQSSMTAGTCTALVYGSLGGDHGWVLLDTLTDDDFGLVPWFPLMYVDVTAVATGTCIVGFAGS